jgi:xylulose-5-phosphate/fructose-6-phosphate phosphoketolase
MRIWRDGAVPPVLHLNGYKIANPTVLAWISTEELRAPLEGYGTNGKRGPRDHRLLTARENACCTRARGPRGRPAARAVVDTS